MPRLRPAPGQQPPSALAIATALAERGWNVTPVAAKSKRPIYADWQNRVIGADNVAEHFNGLPRNVGIIMGPSSGGLLDIDLDSREAIEIAPFILPRTGAIFGRPGAPGSHWLYKSSTLAGRIGKAALAFDDPKLRAEKQPCRLLELRCGPGAQTVGPGSVHESGEIIDWERDKRGEPAEVDDDDLLRRVKLLAAGSLLARFWPGKGARHDIGMTVGGFLARTGIPAHLIKPLVEGIARAAGDEEPDDRVQAAEDAATNFKTKRGYPKLAEAFGDQVASEIARPEWLDYAEAKVETEPPKPIIATPYTWKAPESLPPRQWLYGRRLMRQIVSATVAPGGIGKTALTVADALAMVSGKPLLGIQPPQRLRVWIWNLEEPREEMERQIQATAKLYGLGPDDIGDRLYLDVDPLVIATTTRDRAAIVRPITDALVDEIKRRQVDAMIIDPFVSCHELIENDNKQMDMVAKEWKRVAITANCAGELVHHVRKGDGEITAESARGGGAFVDALRNVRVLNRMSKDEAGNARIANHRLYFRTFSDKANKVPPADASDWFKLESVDLCNDEPGKSDLIGVPRRWEWPDAMAGLAPADFDKVAAAIRAAKWRESPQAKAWVGHAVAQALGLNAEDKADRARIMGMIKIWFAAGSLIRVEGEDENRIKRVFVMAREE